ncbi:MAG: thiolase family protein [Acidimicrobiia bacterium]|nr:thiolase family protein [Acidimicrobiia bacterium]
MRFDDAWIPVGLAWSSPFVRWQGALGEVSSLDLAAQVTRSAFERAGVETSEITDLVLGWTVPQPGIFYGVTTLAGRIGAPGVTGPMISQACATSVASLQAAAVTAQSHPGALVAAVATDRTSNGPLLSYPQPSAPGGSPQVENWVLDNFARDPWGGTSMVATAEAVASEAGISRSELDELTLCRYEQYERALAAERAFQEPWMVPVSLPGRRSEPTVIDADQGVTPTTAEGLARLAPVQPDGVVTYGSQTHPADGTAGMVVTCGVRARELGRAGMAAQVRSTGFARVAKARMPQAPVPAAQVALRDAGIEIDDVDVVKTHNPFAVNDVYFGQQMGIDATAMNDFGCSLVYGHPQGPTGARAIAELIEMLVRRGGGIGLFTGCAAGDTAAATVLEVR